MITIDTEERNNAVIVSLAGELTMADIEEFEHTFRKYLNTGLNVIALDLKEVQFLDSFGISRIIKISRSFVGSGTDFVLINLNEQIHQIFRMATFDRIFTIMTREDFRIKYLPSDR